MLQMILVNVNLKHTVGVRKFRCISYVHISYLLPLELAKSLVVGVVPL